MNISTSTIAQSRRKPTQNIIDDEDASELRLGPEFSIHQISHDNVETPLITLNLSETRLLINAALKERRRQENGGDLGDADGNDNDEDEDFSNSNEYVPNYRFFSKKNKQKAFLLTFFFFLSEYSEKPRSICLFLRVSAMSRQLVPLRTFCGRRRMLISILLKLHN